MVNKDTLLIVVKSRHTVVDKEYEHGLINFFPHSLNPVFEADLVLYAPLENKFLLFSRNRVTGKRITKVRRGNLNGHKHAQSFNPKGCDSTKATEAIAAMLKSDLTPPTNF